MRSDHNIREGQESCGNGMLQNLIGTVFKYVRGLLLIYIKSDTEEFMSADTFDQVVGFTSAPLDVLTRITPSFIFEIVSRLIR